jgi:hypothetical protein
MRRIDAKSAAAAAILAMVPGAAAADTNQDGQVWTSLTGIKPLSDKVDVTVETHLRFNDDFGGVAQLLWRPSVTYKLPSRITATIGYLYFRNDPETGRTTNEHRVWEQIGYSLLGRADGVRLTGRTRLEQRFQHGSDGAVGWRVRQQLRVEVPLSGSEGLRAVAWNETFLGLNDTSWGARSGFDQTRTFVGGAVPIAPKITMEPGYLNQFIERRGPDQVNHVLALNLTVRL